MFLKLSCKCNVLPREVASNPIHNSEPWTLKGRGNNPPPFSFQIMTPATVIFDTMILRMKQGGDQEPEIIFSIFISRRGAGRGLGQFSAKKGSLSVRFLWEGKGGGYSQLPQTNRE